MSEDLNYVDFYFANKIRFNGGSTNLKLSGQDKSAIFAIRRYIEVTGNSVHMSAEEFFKMVGWGNCLDIESRLSTIVNNIKANKLLIMDSMYTGGTFTCYGTPALVLTTRTGNEYNLPEVFSEDIPQTLSDKFSVMADFYVYVCKHNGRVIYVGKGTRERFKHCLSGKSSSNELNKLVKEGAALIVEKVAENLTEEMAIQLEESYIRAMVFSGTMLHNKSLPKDVREFIPKPVAKAPVF